MDAIDLIYERMVAAKKLAEAARVVQKDTDPCNVCDTGAGATSENWKSEFSTPCCGDCAAHRQLVRALEEFDMLMPVSV